MLRRSGMKAGMASQAMAAAKAAYESGNKQYISSSISNHIWEKRRRTGGGLAVALGDTVNINVNIVARQRRYRQRRLQWHWAISIYSGEGAL
jgi:hypothetical protein